MIINMTTIAVRRKHYIDQTLESLSRSDGRDIPVNLILGSNDTSHVEKYRKTLNIVPWDQEAQAQTKEGRLRHNCNVNAIRALKYGDDEYCLCCEDDIVFDPNWLGQLMLTVAEIDGKEYVLNLGQGGDQSPGKRYAIHTRPFLCGAQAIFYPSKSVRRAVAEFVQSNINRGMNDALIGTYAKQRAVLYNTTPVLVRHVGQVSSFTQPTPPVQQTEERRPTENQAKKPGNTDAVGGRPDHTTRPPAANVENRRRPEPSNRATSEILVAFLRASLGTGAALTSLAECDWGRLALLATHHGLFPVMYRALQEHAAGVPVRWLHKFKAQYVANVFHNQLAQAGANEIAAEFSSERIPIIVMKGVALLRTLYDDPGLRVLGDIDLLVEEGDIERAGARLQRMGLNLIASEHADQRGPLCHIHLVYRRPQPRSVAVELHWNLFEPYQPYVFDLDVVRARARPLPDAPPNVLAMAPEHELAHLCVHLDRHAVTYRSLIRRADWFELLSLPQGLGRLQWLYDIALYLQRRSALINWDDFVDAARRWAIDDRLHATLELSRRALGAGPPPEVLRALDSGRTRFVERMAHRALIASHHANETRRSAAPHAARPHWLTPLSGHALRFAHTWMSVFPEGPYLRAKYGAGALLPLRARHLREVAPGLWAETRERMRSAAMRRSREVRDETDQASRNRGRTLRGKKTGLALKT